MADPILRIRASGYGGSGYLIPTRNLDGTMRKDMKEKPWRVPGVTTVLGALEKPGIVTWAVDQTAAYAIANAQTLLERDEEWGFKYLRFYHSRKPDYDNPEVDIHNYHTGVLNDLADTGTIIHEAIEAFVKEDFFGGPTLTRQEHVDAFEAFLDWQEVNQVVFEDCEVTVASVEYGYAGTLDITAVINGRRYLIDIKTSNYRPDKDTGLTKIHDSHISQVAALAKAGVVMRSSKEASKDSYEYKDLHWTEEEASKYDGYAILQVRPTSIDDYGNEIPAFCEFHEIDERLIEPAFQQFMGALEARRGQASMRVLNREIAKDKLKVEEKLPWE